MDRPPEACELLSPTFTTTAEIFRHSAINADDGTINVDRDEAAPIERCQDMLPNSGYEEVRHMFGP